jgi:hypothetical protein
MAAVSDVPDVTGQKIAVGARHPCFLEQPFYFKKSIPKPLTTAYFAIF